MAGQRPSLLLCYPIADSVSELDLRLVHLVRVGIWIGIGLGVGIWLGVGLGLGLGLGLGWG